MQSDTRTARKIVVLDAHTTCHLDLDFEALRAFGDLDVYPRTPRERLRERAIGAEILLTNKAVLDEVALSSLPDLRFVSVLATGTNVVDLEAARRHGVVVSNAPAYSTASTAQTTIALLLELTHQVGRHDRSVHEGRWAACEDFSFTETELVELDGLTMGIVGMGAIGMRVALICQALGMKLIAYSRTQKEIDGVSWVGLDELFQRADVVSLHCPLSTETRNLVGRDRLASMKPTAVLINAGRGPLVDEQALADALNQGRLRGAAVDVLTSEPPLPSNPLLSARNCIVTPHLAWATHAARRRLVEVSVKNVRAYLAGSPINVVV